MKTKKTSEILISCMDKNTGEKGYISLEEVGLRIFESIRDVVEKRNKEKKKWKYTMKMKY